MITRTIPPIVLGLGTRAPRRPSTGAPLASASAATADWMERLATWAKRQPVHHRMGSWERLG